MKSDADSAKVPVPPPLLLLSSILIGVGLHFIHALPIVSGAARWVLGCFLLGGGVGTVAYCSGMFRKAQTAIQPWKTTTHIVTSGPYRFSRNPIYLSFMFVGIGISFLINDLWIALMMIPLAFTIYQVAIRREEKYLEGKFGESYIAYKSHVRRWL